jgi:hypothetical protein
LGKGTTSPAAEKVGVALDFGWRSVGVPNTPGFGVMGWSGSPLRSVARFQSQFAEKLGSLTLL